MSALDRILYIHKDGTIVMHEENDGWTYINSGPEAREYAISEDDLRRDHPQLYKTYAGGPEAAGSASRVYWEGVHWGRDK